MYKKSHKKRRLFSFKTKASTKLGIVALLFIVSILILSRVIGFARSLNEPMQKDTLSRKEYTWDSKTAINIAVRSSSISLLNYDPSTKKIVILKIPDDTYLELPNSLGSWSMGSVYGLGQEESPPVGSELVKKSLSKLLGLPVDGYISFDNSQPIDQIISEWHSNPFKIVGFIKSIKSDLTPLEAFSLFRSLSLVRSDKVSYLDIEQSDITQSKLLPDSSRVLGVNSVNLDLFIRDKMSDERITNEGLSIAIFNSTDHPGLGQSAQRIVTNLGGNVIYVANSPFHLDKTIVVSDLSSETTRRMTQIFAPACLKKCVSSDPKVASSRAQVNIVLGENFYSQ